MSLQTRHVDRARRIRFCERIREGHDMRPATGERPAERVHELIVRRFIRPKGEDTARIEMRHESSQTSRFVERAIARVQKVTRRMIDI